jgi:hypothetical protein
VNVTWTLCSMCLLTFHRITMRGSCLIPLIMLLICVISSREVHVMGRAELLPSDAPNPRGKDVELCLFFYSDHARR